MPRKKAKVIEEGNSLFEKALADGPVWSTKYTYLKDIKPGSMFTLPSLSSITGKLIKLGETTATIKWVGDTASVNISLESEVILVGDTKKPSILTSISDLRKNDDKTRESKPGGKKKVRKRTKGNITKANRATQKAKRKPKTTSNSGGNDRKRSGPKKGKDNTTTVRKTNNSR